MRIAQQLYEGLSLGKEGTHGLITYMRTDATRVSPEAVAEARDYINETHGAAYLPKNPGNTRPKRVLSKPMRDRPTSVQRTLQRSGSFYPGSIPAL